MELKNLPAVFIVAALAAAAFFFARSLNEEHGFLESDLNAGLAGAGIVALGAAYVSFGKKKLRSQKEHGSARWGTARDARDYRDPVRENNALLTRTESLTMNDRPKNLEFARNKNVLVIGGPGSGKTRYFLKPNLMQCRSADYPAAFVVTDPKGTILEECGKMLELNGYEVSFVNTIDFTKSMRYNPFAYIRTEADVLSFVEVLIANTSGKKGAQDSGDPFWKNAEKMLYCALVGYVWSEYEPEAQSFGALASLIGKMEVREEDDDFQNPVDAMFEVLATGWGRDTARTVEDYNFDIHGNIRSESVGGKWTAKCPPRENRNLYVKGKHGIDRPEAGGYVRALYPGTCKPVEPQPEHFAVRQYEKYKLAAGKTAKSILVMCGSRLAPFDITDVREMMEADELELGSLGELREAGFGDPNALWALKKTGSGKGAPARHVLLEDRSPEALKGLPRSAAAGKCAPRARDGPHRELYAKGGKTAACLPGLKDGARARVAWEPDGKGADGKPRRSAFLYERAGGLKGLLGFEKPRRKLGGWELAKVRKRALFVMISDTDAAFNFIPAIMYSQLFSALVYRADNLFAGRLPVSVRCLLDEFPNIGTIPDFEKLIATIRSRGISTAVVVQTLSQLKDIYKESADTIAGNCDTQLFLGGTEKATLEHISAMLGKETIDVASSDKKGKSYQKLGRELMTLSELAAMKGSECVLQIRGAPPFKSKKYDITKHPLYGLTADSDGRHRYDPRKRLAAMRGAEA